MWPQYLNESKQHFEANMPQVQALQNKINNYKFMQRDADILIHTNKYNYNTYINKRIDLQTHVHILHMQVF